MGGLGVNINAFVTQVITFGILLIILGKALLVPIVIVPPFGMASRALRHMFMRT